MATGNDIYQKALTKKGQAYIEGTLVPKDDPNWIGPWDCAELCSWALYQVSKIVYGCINDAAAPAHADAYSGAWKDDAESRGIIIPWEKAAGIPGAMVLRAPVNTLTVKLGGHIVISDGKGGTIEAKGKKWGVTTDTLSHRRWDYGILVPGIDYASAAQVNVDPQKDIVYRLTNPMMVSTKIGQIQQALTNAGYATKGIDNIFGSNTLSAVFAFQKANDLVADGEVGNSTAEKLGVSLNQTLKLSDMLTKITIQADATHVILAFDYQTTQQFFYKLHVEDEDGNSKLQHEGQWNDPVKTVDLGEGQALKDMFLNIAWSVLDVNGAGNDFKATATATQNGIDCPVVQEFAGKTEDKAVNKGTSAQFNNL